MTLSDNLSLGYAKVEKRKRRKDGERGGEGDLSKQFSSIFDQR